MSQAKTLTSKELRRVLDYVATRPHAARNRAIIMCTHLAGMRVGECAALRLSDVIDGDGQVRPAPRWHAGGRVRGAAPVRRDRRRRTGAA